MTNQERADEELMLWQIQKQAGIAPQDRLSCADVGHMTHGIWDNVRDIRDLWIERPERRWEFGPLEGNEIVNAAEMLADLALSIKNARGE